MLAAEDAEEYSHGLELTRELLVKYPDFNVGWLKQGWFLACLRRLDEAEKTLQFVLRRELSDTGTFVCYNYLAIIEKMRGNLTKTEAYFRRMIDLNADDASGYIFLGCLLGDQGHAARAEIEFRRATKCHEGCLDEAHFNLGLALIAQERYEEALVEFEQALKINPKYPKAIQKRRDLELAIQVRDRTGPAE